MENELNITVDNINNELLKLYFASQNKTEYQFYDFHKALQLFNEIVLKEGGISEYSKFKAKQYFDVFKDLLFTESKSVWGEYISYDPKNRILKLKSITYITNKIGTIESIIEEKIYVEWKHEYLLKNIENLKQSPTKPISTNKYNYILENCKIKTIDIEQIDIKHYLFEGNFKDGFDTLFNDYSLDTRSGITFEAYIKTLLFEKEQQTGKPTKPPLVGIKTNLKNDKLKKLFTQLIESGFICPGTKEHNFLHVFAEPLPDGEVFEPVKWIKKGKNKDFNKSSLINLFQILEIDINSGFYEWAYHYFGTDKETNIILKSKNKTNSQYYINLKKIVESL